MSNDLCVMNRDTHTQQDWVAKLDDCHLVTPGAYHIQPMMVGLSVLALIVLAICWGCWLIYRTSVAEEALRQGYRYIIDDNRKATQAVNKWLDKDLEGRISALESELSVKSFRKELP